MVSINVKTADINNTADIDIGMRGKAGDIIHEIALGAVAACKQVTGDKFSYSDAIRLAIAAIAELDNEDLKEDNNV